jgi:hypothetical protein
MQAREISLISVAYKIFGMLIAIVRSEGVIDRNSTQNEIS